MYLRNFLPPKVIKCLRKNIFYRLNRRWAILKQNKFRMYVEVTTFCDAKCIMCNRTYLSKNNEFKAHHMADDILDRLLIDIKKMVQDGYHITFVPMGLGEPLLFPGLLSLFHKVKNISKDIYIILTTNGILLNEKIVKSLIEVGLDEITISLNVDDEKKYKQFMGVDRYNLVLQNIINLLAYKKDNNLTFPGISIQYLESEYLESSFWGVIKFWAPYLTRNDKVYFHEIVSEAGTTNWGGNLKESLKKLRRFPCLECWSLIAVHSNGDVYPCGPIFYWKEKKNDLFLGNILEGDLYSVYFNNPKLRKIREEMLCDNYEYLKTCQSCNNIVLMPNPFFKNVFTNKWF